MYDNYTMLDQNEIQLIKQQLEEIKQIETLNYEEEGFKKWQRKTGMILERVLGENSKPSKEFKTLRFWNYRIMAIDGSRTTPEDMKRYHDDLKRSKHVLEGVIEENEIFGIAKEESGVKTESGRARKEETVIVNVINENNFNLQVNTSFDQILLNVKQNCAPEEYQRAEKKIKEMEKELKKDNPSWDVVKKISGWALGFSKDVFLQLLPLILKNMGRF